MNRWPTEDHTFSPSAEVLMAIICSSIFPLAFNLQILDAGEASSSPYHSNSAKLSALVATILDFDVGAFSPLCSDDSLAVSDSFSA